jgi:hypothetical protein
MIPDMRPGNAIRGYGAAARHAAQGFRELSAFAAGSEDVQLSGAGYDMGMGILHAPIEAVASGATAFAAAGRAETRGDDVGMAMLEAFSGDQRSDVGRAIAGGSYLYEDGLSVDARMRAGRGYAMAARYAMGDPSVRVSVDVSGAMDARTIAAQAGRETERGVYDALQAVATQ